MAGGFIDVAHNEGRLVGGTVDARSFFDGSGWTVSTGSSRATGGARTQQGPDFISGAPTRTVDQPDYELQPIEAGYALGGGSGSSGSWLTLAAAGVLVVAVVLGKKKG